MISLLAARHRPLVSAEPPSFARPDSQLPTAAQIYEPEFARWAELIGYKPVLDRKVWEYCYIGHAIETYCGFDGRRGLCFGAGREALPALFAARGARIVATDLVTQSFEHWQSRAAEDLFHERLIDRATFDANIRFRDADMNAIPDDLTGFDFLWTTGSLEHIGGAAKGLAFVEAAMRCLKPGGIAVHTTEFTISSRDVGHDHPELSFYCEADIRALAERLIEAGHMIVLNFTRGTTAADLHVDMPPYHHGMTLAAHFGVHVISSIGLIIQKGG